MDINQRVRAILLTDQHHVLLFKRVRPGVTPYWVAPGGGIDASDTGPEAALSREMMEELGATIEIVRYAFVYDHRPASNRIIRQLFYLCRLIDRDPSRRTAPEFNDPTRGQYIAEEVPLQRRTLNQLNIQPHDLQTYLAEMSELCV